MSDQKALKILAILPSIIPSTQILIIKPLLFLHQKGQIKLKVFLEAEFNPEWLAWPDLVVFCRNFSPLCLPWLDTLLTRRIPYIYELDDNLLDIPADTPYAQGVRQPFYQANLQRFIRQASLVRVYSNALCERLQPLTTQTSLVAGPLDWSLIHPPHPRHPGDPLKIVYATSRIDGDNLASLFLPALERVLQQYSRRVEVHFLGANPLRDQKLPQVYFEPYCASYDQYLRRFSSAGYDIGLAPLLNDIFHRSKSNIKYREYGASHVAGIYSNVDVYANWVKHGETGLLVENSESEWYNAFVRLIEDETLREHIRQNGYAQVRQQFSQEQSAQDWLEHIQILFSTPYQPGWDTSGGELFSPNAVPPTPPRVPSWKRLKEIGTTEGWSGLWSHLQNRIRIILQLKWLQFRLR